MGAQQHYSAVATTVIVLVSLVRQEEPADDVASFVALEPDCTARTSSHLRLHSVSSVTDQAVTTEDISSPTSGLFPSKIRNAKLVQQQLIHKKSYSSGFSFGAIVTDDVNEMDSLTAGVLPLLVPGLEVRGSRRSFLRLAALGAYPGSSS